MRRSILIGPALAIAALATAPGAALGATVGVDTRAGHLAYQAAPGERNSVRIRVMAAGSYPFYDFATVTIEDSVRIVPGDGCVWPYPGAPTIVRCDLDEPGGGTQVIARLGDRGDRVRFSSNVVDMAAALFGGPGSDALVGAGGPDILNGGPGDDLMFGGAGEDTFDEGTGPNGRDRMHGGPGRQTPFPASFPVGDRVDYGGRRDAIRADLDGDRDDGERGEGDRIAADVESLTGGRDRDRLDGNESSNWLAGGPGADLVAGHGGRDVISASIVPGYAKTKDRLSGGTGSDSISGTDGRNVIDGGPGADIIRAWGGADRIAARDSAVDQVRCGGGADQVQSDAFEFLLDCEGSDPFSDASPVPLEVDTAEGGTRVSLLVGCREGHPAACAGTVQLELGGEPISPEKAFSSRNRQRFFVRLESSRPLPPPPQIRSNLVVRVRAHSAAGAPTDDAFPMARLAVSFGLV